MRQTPASVTELFHHQHHRNEIQHEAWSSRRLRERCSTSLSAVCRKNVSLSNSVLSLNASIDGQDGTDPDFGGSNGGTHDHRSDDAVTCSRVDRSRQREPTSARRCRGRARFQKGRGRARFRSAVPAADENGETELGPPRNSLTVDADHKAAKIRVHSSSNHVTHRQDGHHVSPCIARSH